MDTRVHMSRIYSLNVRGQQDFAKCGRLKDLMVHVKASTMRQQANIRKKFSVRFSDDVKLVLKFIRWLIVFGCFTFVALGWFQSSKIGLLISIRSLLLEVHIVQDRGD